MLAAASPVLSSRRRASIVQRPFIAYPKLPDPSVQTRFIGNKMSMAQPTHDIESHSQSLHGQLGRAEETLHSSHPRFPWTSAACNWLLRYSFLTLRELSKKTSVSYYRGQLMQYASVYDHEFHTQLGGSRIF